MSIPAILGAVVLKLNDLLQTPPTSDEVSGLIAGTLVAFVSGYFSIIWLLEYVKRGRLQWFGYYCLIVSWVGIAWHLWG
jgi:undecaprenyl-diphosphatase